MAYELRSLQVKDYDALLALVDSVVPYDREGNRRWLQFRRAFDEVAYKRRHYIIEDTETRAMVGYGGIEQQEPNEPGRFRMYVVPKSFGLGIEDLLYDRLVRDLAAFDAKVAWIREYQRDENVIDFFQAQGFVQAAVVQDTRLSIADIDRAASQTALQRLDQSGLTIVTLEQEQTQQVDYTRQLFELCRDLLAERRSLSWDQFARWLERPNILPDALFIVKHVTEYVGLVALVLEESRQILVQDFAGMRKAYQRPEVIAALVEKTIRCAQAYNVPDIISYVRPTDSDRQTLNEMMGFHHYFTYVIMEKKLENHHV